MTHGLTPTLKTLVSLTMALCSIPCVALAQQIYWEEEASGREVIFEQIVEVDDSGAIVSDMSLGSLTITLADGAPFVLDLDELEDPDGNQYSIEGGASQVAAGEPVAYEFRVVRYQPRYMTEAEAEQAYQIVHPGADASEVEEFMTWRADEEAPSRPRTVEPEVLDWFLAADEADVLEVALTLTEQPPLEIPDLPNHLLAEDPAVWLQGMEDRLLAIEDRKTELYALQEVIAAGVEPFGAEFTRRYWLFNGMRLEVTPAALAALVDDERVTYVGTIPGNELGQTYYHAGGEIQDATQITQFLDAGYDGRHGSGMSEHGEIYVLVVDGYLDVDHPAWLDGPWWWWGTSSRLIDSAWYRCNPGGCFWESQLYNGSRQQFFPTDQHGNRVVTQLLSDLTKGQDSSVSDPDIRLARSGQSPEVVFSFRERSYPTADYPEYMEEAVWLNVDMVNLSLGDAGNRCVINPDNQDNLAVNSAMHAGIFIVQIAGNDGYAMNPSTCAEECTVWTPAAASGVFTVGAYDHRAAQDLNEAPIWENPTNCLDGSGRGDDAYGRPLIKIATPGGRQWNTGYPEYHPTDEVWVYYDDIYDDHEGVSTSRAAPVATGAAADLKDFLVENTYGAPYYKYPGLLFAHMLLMGDRQTESGPDTQLPGTPLDEYWGAGHLRMRMFDEVGMDEPWRWRWTKWVEDHNEVFVFPLNPMDTYPFTNLPVDDEADWFRAGLWWHEPNLSDPPNPIPTSRVLLEVCRPGLCFHCLSEVPQSQRLWLGESYHLTNYAYEIHVKGTYIPYSIEPNYFEGKRKRRMYLAFYWEDRARDDPEGPPASVQ